MPRKKARARRSSSAKNTCFVIMPFGDWLDSYFDSIYCPAIKNAGLLPRRADVLFRPSTIVTDIWELTNKSKLVLADLSGKNPNVFYELGLAHALAKPVILIADSLEAVPFDLRSLRVHIYDRNASDWGVQLRQKIEKSILEVLKSPKDAVLPSFMSKNASHATSKAAGERREVLELRQEINTLRDQVENPSSRRNRLQLRPDIARAMIKAYVQDGMPDALIIQRLEPYGPPPEWILSEIRKYKRTGRARK